MLTVRTKSRTLDLVATDHTFERDENGKYQVYKTGLSIEIPPGYEGFIIPAADIKSKVLTLVSPTERFYNVENLTLKFKITPNSRPTKDGTYQVGDVIGKLCLRRVE